MTILLQSFRQSVNGTREQVIAQIAAFFLANPAIIVLAITQGRSVDNRKSDRLRVRILYSDVGGFSYTANLISGSATTPIDAAFTIFAAGNPTFRILNAVDLTERAARSIDFGAVLIIGTTDSIHAGNQVSVAQAIGGIAAGGTTAGTAKIYDAGAAQLSASETIVNVSLSSAWPADQRNLAVFDPDTNLLMGIPSCSGTGSPFP